MSLGGCAQSSLSQTPPSSDDDTDTQTLAKIPESIRNDLEHGRARDVLVELVDRRDSDAGTRDAGAFDGGGDLEAPLARSVLDTDEESVSERADRYRQVQERVLEQTASDAVSLRFQYENIPMLHVNVRDLAGMISLAKNAEVLVVHENVRMEHQLAESLPLINQPAAASAGYLGAGTAVAVLDTGCDYTRAAFGSCSSPGGSCKVAYAQDFGGNDGLRDAAAGHGTNVAGIVLGVAPSTKIIALDVFESASASSSSILQAVDWVISHRTTYNIVAMNMSLGGTTKYSAICSGDVFASGIQNARNAGILTAIASGNTAWSNGISSPACVPAAISVGAVWDASQGGLSFGNCSDPTTAADKVTCFSNSASFLSMLAPGARITAAGITMTGTSQASPHVAGAIAVTRAAFPSEPLSATVTRLTSTGPTVTDARNGVALHRLDLNAALGGAGTVDVTPPTGTLKINNGATATKVDTVTLALTGSDDSNRAVSVCVSNTASCSTFTSLTATKTWKLAAGDGLKTVYATFRDPNGNKTTVTAQIRLDATAPSGSTLTATPSAQKVSLSWTPASDTNSGVARYKLQMVANSTTAPTCTTGTTIYTGSGTSFDHTGLVNGATYSYRLCPIDNAGNMGTGPSRSSRPAPEFDGPTGSMSINQGATFTKKTAVTLNISASDATGIATMCVSLTTTCTVFSTYSATKSFTLAATNGTQTVRVWLRDTYGNVSAGPLSDTIVLDTVLPTVNAITAAADDEEVTLSWAASSDTGSGVAGYKVTMAAGSYPTCTTGTVVYNSTARTVTVSGLTNGTNYGFRVCPYDNAGNMTAAGTVTSRPAPEFVGPTGTVVINQGAAFTKSKTVTLALSASDSSGVASMCVSNTTTCTAYVANAASLTWTLAGTTNGTQTVRVWFRDTFGNVSASPTSDTIVLDTMLPTANTITAAAADAKVTLNWTASSDTGSGVAGYKVTMAAGSVPSCSTGTVAYNGPARTVTVSGLTNGTTYGFRVCPYDNAGNLAAGGSVSSRPAPEFVGPTGTVAINQGAQFTNNRTVSLTLSAADPSGVASMCVSSTTTCTSFIPYATSATLAFASTSGTQTVRAWFKDSFGNVSATPAIDAIIVDMTAPLANRLTAVASTGAVALTWTGTTDAASGVAGYRLRMAQSTTTAPTCATGTVIYQGTALSYNHTGLIAGRAYAYRICPYDNAGNITSGPAATAVAK